jgi:hypothetical protein
MYGDMRYCRASHVYVTTSELFGALVCRQIKHLSRILMRYYYVCSLWAVYIEVLRSDESASNKSL